MYACMYVCMYVFMYTCIHVSRSCHGSWLEVFLQNTNTCLSVMNGRARDPSMTRSLLLLFGKEENTDVEAASLVSDRGSNRAMWITAQVAFQTPRCATHVLIPDVLEGI